MRLVSGVLAVVAIYLLCALVLWLLSLIGPISAGVAGEVQQGGATVWFRAAGTLAAFILLAVIALYAVKHLP